MEFFLDSVDINEIRKHVNYGIIKGVTTNPSLMAGVHMGFHEIVKSICENVQGDVSIEVASNNYEDMIKEGKKILSIADNIVIKLPTTWDGIKACRYFTEQNYKVNMTLCFSVNQALFAAHAKATYISPFIGRLEDVGENGVQLISDIRKVYDNYNMKTKILASSIRTTEHVKQAALNGADVITLSAKIISVLLDHPLTEIGLKKFNEDWAKSGMKI